jgi:glycosyltransferase involved in cell wall biosynthesis
VWDAEYPWDVRAEKVSLALTQAGWGVELAARNRQRRPVLESLPEATVHRMPPWPLLPRRLDGALQFPAFFNPRWYRHLVATGRTTGADIILVRDLPLAPTAIAAGRRLGVPVVLDMAENYPAMMRSLWETGTQRPLDWLVRNPGMVAAVERWVLRHVDHVIVVVEESGERLVHLGLDPARITVVGNTPWRRRLDEVPARTHRAGEVLRLGYLGLLEAPRGIATVLRALARTRDAGLRVHATIVGDGMDRGRFEALAAELRLGPAEVRFTGRLPHAEALAAVADADVGLVPHLAVEAWNTTIPNKLFDYMAAGLPVLSSNAKPAARIVRETGAGLVYGDTDDAALAEAIVALREPARRAAFGMAGREAVASRYHWEKDVGRLEAMLGCLAGCRA